MSQYIKNYIVGGAINRYRLVVYGSVDDEVVQASGATSVFAGVVALPSDNPATAGDRVDVIKDRYAPIVYGGAVNRGDPLTSDANGNAVVAEPGAGANVYIIGYAEVSGVSGDVADVFVAIQRIQG